MSLHAGLRFAIWAWRPIGNCRWNSMATPSFDAVSRSCVWRRQSELTPITLFCMESQHNVINHLQSVHCIACRCAPAHNAYSSWHIALAACCSAHPLQNRHDDVQLNPWQMSCLLPWPSSIMLARVPNFALQITAISLSTRPILNDTVLGVFAAR